MALEFKKWDKLVLKQHCLTIKDIKALESGQEISILTLDRNILDRIDNYSHKMVYDTPRHPLDVFAGLMDRFVKTDGLNGKIHWHFEDDPDEWMPFTFELLSKKKRMWYPLDESGYFLLDKKKWTKMPESTKVGWRGQIILWETLNKLPDLYFEDEFGFGDA